MKKYIAIIIALVFVLPTQAKRRPLDEEKTINEIWARNDMPEFNDFKVEDKYKDEPIVFLARYDEFIGKSRVVTAGTVPPITIKRLSRYLVKINDNSAIKSFSEIEYKNFSANEKGVVGIRIHKQDGTIVELNPNDYIKVSTNLKDKKAKNNVTKIAVPNLQKGDIVDYFIYQESDMVFSKQYEYPLNDFAPIQKYRFHGDLTTSKDWQQSWYWLPSTIKAKETNEKDMSLLDFQLTDIEKKKKEPFSAPYKDEPRLKIGYDKYISEQKKGPLEKKFGKLNRMNKGAKDNQICGFFTSYGHFDSGLGITYGKDQKNAVAQIKKYISKQPNLTEKQKAEETYNMLSLLAPTLNLSPKDFWRLYSLLLYKLAISRSQGLVPDRYAGTWEDQLFEDDYNYIIKLTDGTYYYPSDDKINCAIDNPSNYEGMEAIFLNAGNKKMSFKGDKEYSKLQREKIKITPAEKNKTEYTITASLDDVDANALNINRTTSIIGTEKRQIRDDLGTYQQWDSIMRSHFNIKTTFKDDAKKNKMLPYIMNQYLSFMVKDSSFQKDAFEQEAKDYYYNKAGKPKDYKINSYGLFADNPNFSYSITSKVGKLVRTAPNSKIISIGHLMKDIDFTSLKKERTKNIYFPNTFQYVYKICLTIPSGYIVDNLSTLESNVSNNCGAFKSNAKVEKSQLILTVDWKINNVEYSAQEWDKLLEIFNAYESLFNKSVVISK